VAPLSNGPRRHKVFPLTSEEKAIVQAKALATQSGSCLVSAELPFPRRKGPIAAEKPCWLLLKSRALWAITLSPLITCLRELNNSWILVQKFNTNDAIDQTIDEITKTMKESLDKARPKGGAIGTSRIACDAADFKRTTKN
ncbi:hypothetical protein PV325_011520, partial [Microctonus aethiopoides]